MKVYLSLAFLVVIAAVWVYDTIAGVRGKPLETVSATLLEWSQTWPILPLAVGIVLGHLFWPSK